MLSYKNIDLSDCEHNYHSGTSESHKFLRKSIDSVINGNLDENSPRQEKFLGLENTTLRNHQKTLLYHLINLEHNSIKPTSRFTLNSNIGVVGDVVGAGKSLPILLLILNSKLTNTPRDKFFSYSKTANVTIVDHESSNPTVNRIHSSILVLPHTLVRQWRTYIDNYVPSLKYKVVNKREHLNLFEEDEAKYKSVEDFINVPLIIVSATFYSQFMNLRIGNKSVGLMNYDRVIYDEADTIHIPNCYKPNALFNWFVTSSVQNLLLPLTRYWESKVIDGIKCTGFIKNTFIELENTSFPFYHLIFFKNKDEYIQSSFDLPKPIVHNVNCFTPKAVKVLKGILDDKVIQMLQGDDLKGAMEQVGTSNLLKSSNDIIKLSTNMLIKDLENKKREYDYKSTLTYSTDESKKSALEHIQQKIEQIKAKIQLIENRVQNRFCLVCNSDAEVPTVTMCCKNVFCLNCIQCSYKANPMCPFCRSNITENDIVVQVNLPKETVKDIEAFHSSTKVEPKLLNKIDMLIKIITDKPAGKFLVVSLYDNSLNELFEKLKDNNIESTKLGGNNLVVNKTLERFRNPNNPLKCILLNAYSYGSGLNIPETSDIIIYHKLTKALETQVIGRAQRFGRVGHLNIHYLQHDGEY
jgi:SNF2 family DNA or RNA helicase